MQGYDENMAVVQQARAVSRKRGVTRGTLYRYFESSAPVPTFAKPRPTAKPPGVGCKCRATVRKDSVYDILLLQQGKTLAKPLERA